MKLTKTQVGGLVAGGAGLLAMVVGVIISVSLVKQNLKVGASPSDLVMTILGWLFGGGGTVTLGGILTAIISWIRNRNTPIVADTTTLIPKDNQGTLPTSLGIDLGGATGPELTELASAFFTFMRDRTNRPNQRRLITALCGVSDVIPGFKATVELDELVFRAKLAILAPVVSDPTTPSQNFVPTPVSLQSAIGT